MSEVKRWMIGEHGDLVPCEGPFRWDPVVVLASDYDALAAENARLRKFLTDEREQLMMSIRGSTHWDGCHKVHRSCARVREIDAALREKP